MLIHGILKREPEFPILGCVCELIDMQIKEWALFFESWTIWMRCLCSQQDQSTRLSACTHDLTLSHFFFMTLEHPFLRTLLQNLGWYLARKVEGKEVLK